MKYEDVWTIYTIQYKNSAGAWDTYVHINELPTKLQQVDTRISCETAFTELGAKHHYPVTRRKMKKWAKSQGFKIGKRLSRKNERNPSYLKPDGWLKKVIKVRTETYRVTFE